jgi:hypothetical protein
LLRPSPSEPYEQQHLSNGRVAATPATDLHQPLNFQDPAMAVTAHQRASWRTTSIFMTARQILRRAASALRGGCGQAASPAVALGGRRLPRLRK